MKGPKWTPIEDEMIRQAANQTYEEKRIRDWTESSNARLKQVAAKIGRSYGAVRTRASRLGIKSYYKPSREEK